MTAFRGTYLHINRRMSSLLCCSFRSVFVVVVAAVRIGLVFAFIAVFIIYGLGFIVFIVVVLRWRD